MRIAYFTDTYLPEINGVTNTLTKLSGYLEQKGIRHAFFAPDYGRTSVSPAPEDESALKTTHLFPGIRVRISPNSCLAFPGGRQIFDLADEFAPDLVHVTTELGIGYKGMKYAFSRGLPLVTSFHTDYCGYLDYFGLGALEPVLETYLKRFHSAAQKTLVPSAHMLRALMEKGYGNLGIWSRGIDTGRFSADHRSGSLRTRYAVGDKFVFLFVGRLSPEKGLDMLVHAVKEINARYPGEAAFVFTGDGPYAEELRKLPYDNVIMTGFLKGAELAEMYASCDAFAFPSGTETFGNTGLEALASGLPVVAVNRGGVTDYLSHGENALLSPDGDKDAFLRHMLRVMRDGRLRNKLVRNGLNTAYSRDWNSIFDGLMEEYAAVSERKKLTITRQAS